MHQLPAGRCRNIYVEAVWLSCHEPTRRKRFDVPWCVRGCPGLLPALSLSPADRQPGKRSATLAGPAKAPGGLSSVLAWLLRSKGAGRGRAPRKKVTRKEPFNLTGTNRGNCG